MSNNIKAITVCESEKIKKVSKRFIEDDMLFFVAAGFYNDLPQQMPLKVSQDPRLPKPTYRKVWLESHKLVSPSATQKVEYPPLENTECSTSPPECYPCGTQKKVVPPSRVWDQVIMVSVPETVSAVIEIIAKWEALPPDQQPRKTRVVRDGTGGRAVEYTTLLPFVPPGQNIKYVKYTERLNIEQRFETTYYKKPFQTEQLCDCAPTPTPTPPPTSTPTPTQSPCVDPYTGSIINCPTPTPTRTPTPTPTPTRTG